MLHFAKILTTVSTVPRVVDCTDNDMVCKLLLVLKNKKTNEKSETQKLHIRVVIDNGDSMSA